MKSLVVLIALSTLAFAGCSGSSNNAPSTPKNASSLVVTVNAAGGAPQPGATVNLSRALESDGITPEAPILSTMTTDANGQVTFTLQATGPYCINAVYQPSGSSLEETSACNSQPVPATATLTL